jgi:hypothetical protein
MPIKRCTLPGGGRGFQWGDNGKCYARRSQAVAQARAAHSSGYKEQNMTDLLRLLRK